MGFSRQEYWSGLPFSSPGDIPKPGIKPRSPAWEADALPSEPRGKPDPLKAFPNIYPFRHPALLCHPHVLSPARNQNQLLPSTLIKQSS